MSTITKLRQFHKRMLVLQWSSIILLVAGIVLHLMLFFLFLLLPSESFVATGTDFIYGLLLLGIICFPIIQFYPAAIAVVQIQKFPPRTMSIPTVGLLLIGVTLQLYTGFILMMALAGWAA